MKIFFSILTIIFICLSLCFPVCATENIEAELNERLFSEMDDEIAEALDRFGISSLDYESIFNISFTSIFFYYKESFMGCLNNALRLFIKIFAVIILGGAVTLVTDDKKYRDIINALLIPAVTVILVGDINLCISSALSLLKLNGNFMLTFVPVYAIAIAVAGNPATALTYNSLVLGFGEIISAVINYGLTDIIGCFFCISIGFSVNSTVNFPRFISAVNRFVSFVLGLVSSLFTSLLSVRGIFSAATDSVASKGIRFAIGSLIPVIGSSISDAYSTLLGSIGILKNSVALVGILAVIIINLPVITEIVLFNISLNLASFISELFECNELSNILKAFACGVKITGLLVVFEAFILIISTAVMLTVRGG